MAQSFQQTGCQSVNVTIPLARHLARRVVRRTAYSAPRRHAIEQYKAGRPVDFGSIGLPQIVQGFSTDVSPPTPLLNFATKKTSLRARSSGKGCTFYDPPIPISPTRLVSQARELGLDRNESIVVHRCHVVATKGCQPLFKAVYPPAKARFLDLAIRRWLPRKHDALLSQKAALRAFPTACSGAESTIGPRPYH